MENNDLKFIKKFYGENFAHLCRDLFPTLLEEEGLLKDIIESHFAPSRSLYEDVLPIKNQFKAYAYGFTDYAKKEKEDIGETKTPSELMSEAGYILFPECQTPEEVMYYKKYWEKGAESESEILCTFRDPKERLENCRVWFAVKKDFDKIEKPPYPDRQDEYGTSALCIQFTKGENSTVSIKNRYNDKVPNADATFGNDLDKIAPGLERAFVETYEIPFMINPLKTLNLPGYRTAVDGLLYKVNTEINNYCFCENNIILESGEPMDLDKARYLLADEYVLDKQRGKIYSFFNRPKDEEDSAEEAPAEKKSDSFVDSLGDIDQISVNEDENGNKIVTVTPKEGENVVITLSRSGAIIGYNNPNVKEMGDDFLYHNRSLRTFIAPQLQSIGEDFLCNNDSLQTMSTPELTEIGKNSLEINDTLETLDAPNLEDCPENLRKALDATKHHDGPVREL